MSRLERSRATLVWGIIAILLAIAPWSFAAGSVSGDFLRFEETPDGGRLQTSIVAYTRDDGARVDLVGAVHVADRAYFDTLNRSFAGYDAVLYEMIKPADVPVPTPAPVGGRPPGGFISLLQRGLQNALRLDYQLDVIDYSPNQFVHADLDPRTFSAMRRERGETFVTLLLRPMLFEMARPAEGQATFADYAAALQSDDPPRHLKRLLATQMRDVDRLIETMEGPQGSVILQGRNDHAMAVLREQLDAGKRELAVFYGAAHLPGMERTLTEEMGFRRLGEPIWITAWDLTTPTDTDDPSTQTVPTTPPTTRHTTRPDAQGQP